MMNWQKFGIDISKISGGKGFCPKCHQARKHKRDRSLSVDVETGLFNCHNCEFRGCARDFKPKKEYAKPVARLEKISKKAIEFFESRGISNNTTLALKISEASEFIPQHEKEVPCICFNYYRGEELINIKFRGPQKSFKMVRDAELIFYNLNSIDGFNEAVIVEGEIDCLTMHECGIYNTVSVPNGASAGNLKLDYLDNCWQFFEDKKKIILAVDGDEPGLVLRNELARRLGKERCSTVQYPEGCKDANDVLLKHGKAAVVHLIEQAKEWPLEGVKTMDEMFSTVYEWYSNGYPEGARCKVPGFDHLLTFTAGQLTVGTGIPGHGKDEFFNWIMAGLAKNEGWSFGVCGFEEEPEQTVTKLVEKLTGKSFGFRKDPSHRITIEDFEYGVGQVDKYFNFYNTEEIETDLDALLQLGETLVRKKGIKGLYINPWNWIEHNKEENMSETEYVSYALGKIIRFARKWGVHVFLIAHTTKIQKDKNTKKYEVPTLYSISGSANFYNKTHNGITVYRDYETNIVDVYVQKVKQSWLGQIGFSSYNYDTFTRQYGFINSSVSPRPDQNWKPIKTDED